MVNLPRGREVSGLHGVRSLFQGAILRLVRLNGLSVPLPIEVFPRCQQASTRNLANVQPVHVVGAAFGACGHVGALQIET